VPTIVAACPSQKASGAGCAIAAGIAVAVVVTKTAAVKTTIPNTGLFLVKIDFIFFLSDLV
jgi:hypothetical protein